MNDNINELKIKVYDLIAQSEKYRQVFQKLQEEIAALNKQIYDLQNGDEKQ